MVEQGTEKYVLIGELAKHLGITTRTIRYYEEIGLMKLSPRPEGSPRHYSKQDVMRLKFILKLKNLGIGLKKMHELAENYDLNNQDRDTIIPKLLEILEQHLKTVDQKMKSLSLLNEEIINYRQRILGITSDRKAV
jgi:DNA-binding transcriptional MerR regulator